MIKAVILFSFKKASTAVLNSVERPATFALVRNIAAHDIQNGPQARGRDPILRMSICCAHLYTRTAVKLRAEVLLFVVAGAKLRVARFAGMDTLV